jgi:hypothetical protein
VLHAHTRAADKPRARSGHVCVEVRARRPAPIGATAATEVCQRSVRAAGPAPSFCLGGVSASAVSFSAAGGLRHSLQQEGFGTACSRRAAAQLGAARRTMLLCCNESWQGLLRRLEPVLAAADGGARQPETPSRTRLRALGTSANLSGPPGIAGLPVAERLAT